MIKILVHRSIIYGQKEKCSSNDNDSIDGSVSFQAPLVPEGTPVVNALAKQRSCIENVLHACLGLPPENNMLLEHKLKYPLIAFGNISAIQNGIEKCNRMPVTNGTADVPKQLVEKIHQNGPKNYIQG
jgi:hypothetical protein